MVFTACGKDIKVSIKAAEVEKGQPAAALTRKIDVTYRSADGQEQLRETVAVLGLSQPASLKSDLVKKVEWKKEGKWEAWAYSADGILLLKGTSQPDPDQTSLVEIELNRKEVQTAALGSALLRKIRIANAPELSNYRMDAQELSKIPDLANCKPLPNMMLHPASGVFPTLVFVFFLEYLYSQLIAVSLFHFCPFPVFGLYIPWLVPR